MSSYNKPAKHTPSFITECQAYTHEMIAFTETNINEHNRTITKEKRWDEYRTIRSHNTFVEGGENVPGITLKANKCISKMLQNSVNQQVTRQKSNTLDQQVAY